MGRTKATAQGLKHPLLPLYPVVMALTHKQEKFALLVVKLGNQAAAYRQAYDVGPKTSSETIWADSSAMANAPEVSLRIEALRKEAFAQTVVEVSFLINRWYDIARADPNEIIAHLRKCCRHCHGLTHAFQWRDMEEWVDACASSLSDSRAPPEMNGGFGYNPTFDPITECPRCYGEGVPYTRIADTTKLTGPAKLLYKGVKETRHGIEILMHDQHAAADSLARLMGAYKDVLPGVVPTSVPVTPLIEEGLTADESARKYMRLVG